MNDIGILKILFYGLIAFNFDHPTDPRNIEILLLKADRESKAADTCTIHEHVPFLAFVPASGQACNVGPCEHRTFEGKNFCWCKLTQHKIYFLSSIYPIPMNDLIEVQPNRPLPAQGDSRFVWTPRLRNVHTSRHLRGDGDLLENGLVSGQLELSRTTMKTCGFAEYEGKIYSYRFRPLTSDEPVSKVVQSLAESVMLKYQVNRYDDVEIRLEDIGARQGGGELLPVEDSVDLRIDCSMNANCKLYIGNTPYCEDACEHERHRDYCGPGNMGRDFERYYDISEIMSPFAFKRLPVPHRVPGSFVTGQPADGCPDPLIPKKQSKAFCRRIYESDRRFSIEAERKSARSLSCTDDKRVLLVTGRAICPMAVFEE